MFYVYVLFSKKHHKIYIGQSCDLDKRLEEHNLGLSHYTKTYIPWEIVYKEEHSTRIDALRREKQLKSSEEEILYGRRLLVQSNKTGL